MDIFWITMDGSRIIKKYDNKTAQTLSLRAVFVCHILFFTEPIPPENALLHLLHYSRLQILLPVLHHLPHFPLRLKCLQPGSMEISFSLSPIARTFSNCIPSFSQSIYNAFPLEALVEFSSIMPSPVRRNAMPGMGLPFSSSFCASSSVKTKAPIFITFTPLVFKNSPRFLHFLR